MDTAQTKVIVILSGILLAVIIVSVSLMWLLPSSSGTPTPTTSGTPTTSSSPDSTAFDTSLFQQSTYVGLDKQLIQTGQLPVQPPATVGKPNPFL